jgi:hypothetical protein
MNDIQHIEIDSTTNGYTLHLCYFDSETEIEFQNLIDCLDYIRFRLNEHS